MKRVVKAIKKRLARTPIMAAGRYTADQGLAWLERTIKAEKRRLVMGSWISWFKGKSVISCRRVGKPACGTVACAAGWINIGTRGYTGLGGEFGSERAIRSLGLAIDGPTARALYLLFYKTGYNADQVLTELAQIRRDHAEELKAAKFTVERA